MLEAAVARAASSQHAEVTVEHVLQQILAAEDGDAAAILRHVGEDRLALTTRVERVLNHAHTGSSARPVFARSLFEWFEDAWLFASLELQDQRLRSGALLFQLASDPSRYSGETFPELERIPTDRLKPELDAVLRGTSEAGEAAPSAAAPGGSPAGKTAAGRAQDSALARFCKDFTAEARSGRIDPIFGRHREVRQMIDILARRRKNNPIIVGEPGVGKTALVEGLAHLIARGEVPESLKNTEVMGLDLGLLQAGASVKGEFENRLKSVISEVRA
ncbi:MAG: type VI secretion system ATPase TssH, partial [Polyangiaceae bacterium]|nr:type VI secretion system ATPase TssH [Polyangiaceae bacterium]